MYIYTLQTPYEYPYLCFFVAARDDDEALRIARTKVLSDVNREEPMGEQAYLELEAAFSHPSAIVERQPVENFTAWYAQ
jgi:hypothetical protein